MTVRSRITTVFAIALTTVMFSPAQELTRDRWKDTITLAERLHEEYKFAEARAILLGVIKDASQHQERAYRLAYTFNNLGSVAQDEGHYFEAETYYRRSIAHWREGGERLLAGLGRTLNNLASLLDSVGKSGEAQDLLERSEALHLERGDSRTAEAGVVLLNRASTYVKQRKFAESEEAYRQAWAIFEPRRASRSLELAQVAVGLGRLSQAAGFHDAARWHYAFARDIWDQHLQSGKASPQIFLDLAGVYSSMKEFGQAKIVLHEGLIVTERDLGPRHATTADMLMMYAKTLRQTGNKAEAVRMEKRARAVRANSQERLARHTVAVGDLLRGARVRR